MSKPKVHVQILEKWQRDRKSGEPVARFMIVEPGTGRKMHPNMFSTLGAAEAYAKQADWLVKA